MNDQAARVRGGRRFATKRVMKRSPLVFATAMGLTALGALGAPTRAQAQKPAPAPAATPAPPAPAPAPTPAPTPAPPPSGPPADTQLLLMPAEPPEVASDDEAAAPEEIGAPAPVGSPLVITGYVDVGYAKAQGDGTSFRAGDVGVPRDYRVDPFATAVNSRGEVASTNPGTPFVNGFLPRSVGIGGTPSFLLNTASVDLRYTAPQAPVLVFTRVQMLPRFDTTGETTRVVMEQAFGRVTPLANAELAISVGKFDSVFGIEYLDNQANFRIGVTPSLLARYTSGQSVGVKVFYRNQFGGASAVSLNAAATNSGTFVEALQGPDRSLTGVPVGSARVGYELNLASLSLKLGGSGAYGPRNDQLDRDALQKLWGFDARLFVARLSVSAEYVHVQEDEGSADGKLTGLGGTFPFGSGFLARGFWAQLSYDIPLVPAPLRIIPYARYEQRHAAFQGNIPITVDRFTFGLHVDLWENVQVKGEMLINRELAGAAQVDNNVYTSSVVWTW
jgi:hypothetical protein